jgi:hypothetical protein
MTSSQKLTDLLKPQGEGQTKTAAAGGAGYSREDMEKAAAVAAFNEQLGVMEKEAQEKLAEQMAHLGYCFGWGLNKAAFEFASLQKEGVGDTGAAPTAPPQGAGDPGGTDPTSLLQDNEDLKLTGYPGHGNVAAKVQQMVDAKVTSGVDVEGKGLNDGEQSSPTYSGGEKKGSDASDLAKTGMEFRNMLLNSLGQR